jgi:hypothetical protein
MTAIGYFRMMEVMTTSNLGKVMVSVAKTSPTICLDLIFWSSSTGIKGFYKITGVP